MRTLRAATAGQAAPGARGVVAAVAAAEASARLRPARALFADLPLWAAAS